MTIRQINDNLWLQELDLGIFDVRGALVIGERRAVVWDTLSHPDDMRAYLPLLEGKELFIIYSHADWDHIWGTTTLTEVQPDAPIVAHQLCKERFADDVPQTLAGMQQQEPGKWDNIRLIAPTVTFAQKLHLDLGGISLELHHLAGHTQDCIIAIIPELAVALMGDTIETPFPVVAENSPLNEWTAALQTWAQDERITAVIPSHGPSGGRELIGQTVDYLEKLAAGEPIDLPETMTDFYRATHEANLRWRKS